MGELLAVLIGLGLAASCGLRVFVPLAALSIAARAGYVSVSPSMAWLGSDEAMIALCTATVLEIVAYKVPWLDHALDTIASPAAVVAGAIVAASQVGTVTPEGSIGEMLSWACALIAGGAVAGVVQAGAVTTRAASTALTAGMVNPLISVGQSSLAVGMSALSVIAPAVAAVMVVILLSAAVLVLVMLVRWRARRRAMAAA
ncbi:MAG: DUF4126 domain-containing protein [Phycisphaerales bacterium]|nr:DUF4126 domain-containing protein [Phycisphaerales bacterium]